MNSHPANLTVLVTLFAPLLADDIVNQRFATSLQAAGSIAAGWIPGALPACAFDIWASYSIANRRGHGGFSFDPGTTDELSAVLSNATVPPTRNRLPFGVDPLADHHWIRDGCFLLTLDRRRGQSRFWLLRPHEGLTGAPCRASPQRYQP